MPKKRYSSTEDQFNRWIKEGRGSGRLADYTPWITVRDVPSEGRSHRVFGHKCQRTHHMLSDIELAVFLLMEWHLDVVEIREQFPLEREATLRIAKDAGIAHPAVSGVMQYMSSDFLVDTKDINQPKFALQVKPSSMLQDKRVIEKLELERRYWLEKGIPWYVVTEKEIPVNVIQNISWIYPMQRDEIALSELIEKTNYFSYHFSEAPNRGVIDICKDLDMAYTLPIGQSIRELRQLLAHRCFKFNCCIEIHKLQANQFKKADVALLTEALYVSNQ